MSFDLNITVNGSRCKQYQHQGKTYIEAKNGSEYVLEIKNNYWKRILAVCSVDGLNVLTGKTASEKDSGYIVPAYSTEKIKGFRFSDDEWAMFKFGYKFYGNTYAQSKGGDAEKNCGVIGFRLFYEQEPVVQYTTTWTQYPNWNPTPWNPYPTWTTCGGISGSGPTYTSNVTYNCSNLGSENLYACNNVADMSSTTKGSNPMKFQKLAGIKSSSKKRSSAGGASAQYCADLTRGLAGSPEPEFDMGTEWGRRESSKVHTVQFDRGCLARSMEIYYASREQLIRMGVPIHNVLSVPQAFPSAYAEPPKGWNG